MYHINPCVQRSIVIIDSMAVSGCIISTHVLQRSIVIIDSMDISGCTVSTSVLQRSIVIIDSMAVSGCTVSTSVLQRSIVIIDSVAISGCIISTSVLQRSIVIIDSMAISGCTVSTHVLWRSVVIIDSVAISGCTVSTWRHWAPTQTTRTPPGPTRWSSTAARGPSVRTASPWRSSPQMTMTFLSRSQGSRRVASTWTGLPTWRMRVWRITRFSGAAWPSQLWVEWCFRTVFWCGCEWNGVLEHSFLVWLWVEWCFRTQFSGVAVSGMVF